MSGLDGTGWTVIPEQTAYKSHRRAVLKSCHTWSRPHLCIPEKTARSCRGLQEGGHSFPAFGSGILGRLALGCRGGGKEAGGCACQAERAGGERGAAPPLGETWPSIAARQCCYLGQPSAHAPSPCSGRIPLNCTTSKPYLECTSEHCPTISQCVLFNKSSKPSKNKTEISRMMR